MEHTKRTWSTPYLIQYGDVQEITGDTIVKYDGSGDSIKIGSAVISVPGSNVEEVVVS